MQRTDAIEAGPVLIRRLFVVPPGALSSSVPLYL